MKNAASIRLLAALGTTVLSVLMPLESAGASVCFGTSANGRVSDAVALPAQGENYGPYSSLGVTLGRTHVHQTVRDIVADAYAAAYRSMPATRFVYGETGLSTGGPFKPHRTHQNGTSVDFMVPVLDSKGKSVALPSNVLNKFGYALEFDANGKLNDLQINFEAVAEHLYQLAIAAKKHGAPINRVIFQKELVAQLYRTKRGEYLRRSVTFMKATPWIRHDEHYHVDFTLPCRPITDYGK